MAQFDPQLKTTSTMYRRGYLGVVMVFYRSVRGRAAQGNLRRSSPLWSGRSALQSCPRAPKSARNPQFSRQSHRRGTATSSMMRSPSVVLGLQVHSCAAAATAFSGSSRAIKLPHGCRWARSWPAAAFLGGLDGANIGSSAVIGAAPRTQRGFLHF
jgi:hypothetical protein